MTTVRCAPSKTSPAADSLQSVARESDSSHVVGLDHEGKPENRRTVLVESILCVVCLSD
jgi:Ni,Fe-hydrogenase III component G